MRKLLFSFVLVAVAAVASAQAPAAAPANTVPGSGKTLAGVGEAVGVTEAATITAIDPKAHTVTLQGPKGTKVTYKVSAKFNFKKVKVGDVVVDHRRRRGRRHAQGPEVRPGGWHRDRRRHVRQDRLRGGGHRPPRCEDHQDRQQEPVGHADGPRRRHHRGEGEERRGPPGPEGRRRPRRDLHPGDGRRPAAAPRRSKSSSECAVGAARSWPTPRRDDAGRLDRGERPTGRRSAPVACEARIGQSTSPHVRRARPARRPASVPGPRRHPGGAGAGGLRARPRGNADQRDDRGDRGRPGRRARPGRRGRRHRHHRRRPLHPPHAAGDRSRVPGGRSSRSWRRCAARPEVEGVVSVVTAPEQARDAVRLQGRQDRPGAGPAEGRREGDGARLPGGEGRAAGGSLRRRGDREARLSRRPQRSSSSATCCAPS